MTKPRITKNGMLWACYAPLRPGRGFGLTPSEAYRNWLLDSQRPLLPPRLVPLHEPLNPWPAYQPPQYAPWPMDRRIGVEPWQPPWTITCRH